jgi:hypothetical protein
MHRNLYVAGAAVLLVVMSACAQDAPKAAATQDEPKLQPKSRAFLLRGLIAEMTVVRKTLPRGREGIHVNSDGQVDERRLQMQLANAGPALRPGEAAQITKVDFRKDSIVFDLNGGGVQKKKWYQNIEVSGSVGATVTQDQQQAEQMAGCQVTLDFGHAIPDLSVEEVKTMLAAVLDFSQRSASLILTDTWPPEIQEKVKNHQLAAGMTKDQVLASRGKPDNKIREKKGQIEQETWIYGTVPSKVMLVVFEGDEVVEAKEYIPGIPATKVPREGDPQ